MTITVGQEGGILYSGVSFHKIDEPLAAFSEGLACPFCQKCFPPMVFAVRDDPRTASGVFALDFNPSQSADRNHGECEVPM
jgi:hypothetical protein